MIPRDEFMGQPKKRGRFDPTGKYVPLGQRRSYLDRQPIPNPVLEEFFRWEVYERGHRRNGS